MTSIIFNLILIFGAFIVGWMIFEIFRSHRSLTASRQRLVESRLEDEREIKEFVAFWNERIDTGTVINLFADKRLHLLGKNPKKVNWFAASQTFRRDVYDWSRANLNHPYGFVPFLDGNDQVARIWFADVNDAMFFKMRWY